MTDMEQYILERDEALRSLDVDRVLALFKRYNPGLPVPSREVIEAGMHKARTAILNLPIAERRASKAWLDARGLSSLDDGDL